ncbi:hypothetical protein [Flagellimonas marinaquae]
MAQVLGQFSLDGQKVGFRRPQLACLPAKAGFRFSETGWDSEINLPLPAGRFRMTLSTFFELFALTNPVAVNLNLFQVLITICPKAGWDSE